jgi:nicotinamidase-related amidase
MPTTFIDAEPGAIEIDPARTAAVVIDMQRDFLARGGAAHDQGSGGIFGWVSDSQRVLAALQ